MPRPTPYERAKLYVSRMPAAISGSGGHNATFAAAMVLVQGFDLPAHEATVLLEEYNQRCEPKWNPGQLAHKLRQADAQAGFNGRPRGCLRDEGGSDDDAGTSAPAPKNFTAPPQAPKPAFDLETLRRAAGEWTRTVDLLWLANRSAIDPALVSSAKFLSSIYAPGERVLCFTNDKTQGEALWPGVELPTTGPRGVWYLCQPIDGERHHNPRTNKLSRRSEESVTAWRFLVLESDKAPMREWLGALAQLPLRIAAIYTSGGRSIHALVQVDAPTKAAWDDEKHAMRGGLVILGADPGAMSAVRLTRLPGAFREGKDEEQADGSLVYRRFENPELQKLLYLNPNPPMRPLVDMLARRDIERDWLRLAESAPAGDERTARGLYYYARQSRRLRDAYTQFVGDPF